jgi:hypothetical protein
MIKRHNWSWRKPWKADAEFRVASAEPGITFAVKLHLEGHRSRRMPEPHAAAFACGLAVKSVTAIARHYTALTTDAAQIAATAACLAAPHPWRGLHIGKVELKLGSDQSAQEESARLALLQRTAQIGGAEAVIDATRAEALHHAVLADHTTTTAYLLARSRPGDNVTNLAKDAAALRRNVDDYRPAQQWIRVAEALNTLLDRKRQQPEQIRDMLQNLADWAGHYDGPLAASIIEAMSDKKDQSEALEEAGPPPDSV